MGLPIIIVSSGGLAATESENGLPVVIATNGFGIAVTVVESGGLPMKGLGAIIPPVDSDHADYTGTYYNQGAI